MNKTLFTLAVVSAFAAGSAFATSTNVHTENFDSRATGAIAGQTGWTSGENDQSEVKEANGGKYLELKTEGDTLTNTLASASVANDAIANGGTVVFESDIKFVASDTADCGLTGGTDDTKFAIFAYAPDGGPTNLVVFHASDVGVYTNEVIDVDGELDDPDAYTKVTVRVFVEPGNAANGLFFTVALNDGEPLEHAENAYSAIGGDYELDPTWFKTVNSDSDGADAFSAICLKGTGAVDNISVVAEEAAAEDWAADPTDVTGQTAAEAYPSLDNTALASADAEALTQWAGTYGVDYADVADDPGNYVDAFLLNCDPTDVDDEAEEFVATITIDGNGDIVVTPPDGKTYNVTPQLKGKASLTDADWDDLGDYDTADTTGYQFFMLELSL